MITNTARTLAVSNLGWVDSGTLWVYDAISKEQKAIKVDDSEYLELFLGENDLFAVLHHTKDLQFHVSIRQFSNLAESVADAYVGNGGSELTGDLSAFKKVPRFYVGYFNVYRPVQGVYYGKGNYLLFKIDATRREVEFHEFEWFTNKHYDLGYQGITGVTECKGADSLVISIQRDSNPVIYDYSARSVVGKIELGGLFGSSAFYAIPHSDDYLVVDYDSVVLVDGKHLKALRRRNYQGNAMFVGALDVDSENGVYHLSRPGFRDVVTCDIRSLEIKHKTTFTGQPISASRMHDGTIIALDWKSGRLLVPAG